MEIYISSLTSYSTINQEISMLKYKFIMDSYKAKNMDL